jgi:hypothetical protein
LTAFVASNGAVNNFDSYTGGSVNATLDTYTISNQSTLVVRTDSNACANHSVAFGSLDTVSFSGTGGELKFDPTYVRVVAYTAGSGNSPAFGATISQGGVSGVFLGAWTNWSSECIVPAAAIGATGFIKIGGVTGGAFAAGALTGITATCSGPDVQGWIEVRGDTVATINVPRVGKVTSVEAWFELGTTNGVRAQVLACPTCATAVGTFPGCWIETSAGSGVYEQYVGVGSQVALATTATDVRAKFVWSTAVGLRIGSDGTNNVGFLPPTGCKVRIPATILTNSTRTVSGTGPRVLPNATIATRQEFVTTNAGYFDLRGVVSQWYMNFAQAFYVKYKSCAINDSMILSEIASPLDVDNCIVSPTQAQINLAANFASCFAGGTISNSRFVRFSLASASSYTSQLNYLTGVTFNNVSHESLTLRANGTTGVIAATQLVNCTFTNNTLIGGRVLLVGCQNCSFTTPTYYDHSITTTTTATNPMYGIEVTAASANITITGWGMPLPNFGPYNGLINNANSYNVTFKEVGTSSIAPLVMNAAVTGLGFNGGGNCDGIKIKRMYLSNTRTGPYSFLNSDNNILIENCMGDYADTSVMAALNAVYKGCGLTAAATGQTSVYGTHWGTRFISTTAGFIDLLCNEPTTASAAQCAITGGTPQFSSTGSVLLTKVGDQVTWEMGFYAIGFTALTNALTTATGTNVTWTSGSAWGNHTIEFQINTGSGYGAWTALNAVNLNAQVITATTGFKLKIRATTLVANAGNVLTRLAIPLTTTSAAQETNLYPLNTVNITVTVVDSITLAAVQNARVRITTNIGSNLVLEGTTNASGILTGTTSYTGSAISGKVRRATEGDGTLYKASSIVGTIGTTDYAATVLLIPD